MSRAKHTPGPWEARGKYVFADSDCIGICDTDNASDGRMEANALLMASSLDLLRAGRHLAVKLSEVYRAAGANPAECQAIRDWIAAAAKAEPRHD